MRLFLLPLLVSASTVLASTVQDYIGNAPPGVTWTADMFSFSDALQAVVSGPDGTFDQDGDAFPGGKDTRACVCEDWTSRAGGASLPMSVCLNLKGDTTQHFVCTGKGDATDNQVAKCTSGYQTSSPPQCRPSDSSPTANPTGPGKCVTPKRIPPPTDAALIAQFVTLPCDYFAAEMAKAPAGECRYFCVGEKGNYKLQCPENTLLKCANGCTTKYEARGLQCGKAACALPSGQGY